MKRRLTCKELCALLIAREDRKLAIPDRVLVRLHLLACKTCPAFERQLITMRNELRHWRGYLSHED